MLANIIGALSLFIIFLLPNVDTDFGWHLRCGQEFLSTGKQCLTNTYSYFLPNYSWGYSSLVYDLSLALLHNSLGFWGVTIFGALLIACSAVLFYQLFSKSKTIYLSLAFVYLASWPVLGLGYRAQVLTFLFFVIEILLFKRLSTANISPRAKLVYNLLLVMLLFLWSNTHPGFALGILIYGLFSLWQFLEGKKEYLLFLSLGLLATLLTPLGVQAYFEVFRHYQVDLSKLIAEWTAPHPIWQITIAGMWLPIAYLVWQKRTQLSFKVLTHLAIFLILSLIAFKAKRHLPLYAFYLSFLLEEYGVLTSAINWLRLKNKTLNYALLAMFILVGLLNLQRLSEIKNFSKHYCETGMIIMPCKAVKALPSSSKRLFTSYEWGGFLIWQKPELKVFVDGRTPAWKTKSGKSPYTIYLEIIQAQPHWEKTLIYYKTDTLLIPNGTFLDLELQKGANRAWQEIYRDPGAAIYQYKPKAFHKGE